MPESDQSFPGVVIAIITACSFVFFGICLCINCKTSRRAGVPRHAVGRVPPRRPAQARNSRDRRRQQQGQAEPPQQEDIELRDLGHTRAPAPEDTQPLVHAGSAPGQAATPPTAGPSTHAGAAAGAAHPGGEIWLGYT
ncbi:hypothetical protein VSDG_06991 [Cytospora chrysosperma]|uniref:Uncharacterized protein n=1 Tax=Cytospora chrysosperma TaxID=252740 RepID=A0A423VRM9_CYTCH|nr:hypothetical protein VSDG_06991 [Valsa sordida]